MNDEKLYAPDLNEGVLDVERYTLPHEDTINDPYLKKVWALVRHEFDGGEYQGEDDDDGPLEKTATLPWITKSLSSSEGAVSVQFGTDVECAPQYLASEDEWATVAKWIAGLKQADFPALTALVAKGHALSPMALMEEIAIGVHTEGPSDDVKKTLAHLDVLLDGADDAEAVFVTNGMTGGEPGEVEKGALSWVTKGRDASGHEHDARGRFGRGSGGGNREKPRSDTAQAHAEAPKDFGSHAKNLLAHASKVPAALGSKVAGFVKSRYDKLAQRYGHKGAVAVLSAAVLLTPVPLPGTTLIPVALAEAVVALRRVMQKDHEQELSAEDIKAEALEFLAELYAEIGDEA